ncbi:protein FAM167A-like [Anneissia japonica]|uniref:protein FAM167A-like n=1 Tax=Anneissia japonica TaxID=1529436 RepID=UPI001425696E|nr:protein FAM167A-like [Anneissia japonica]XP_033121654.1 protein FAM167A-like [Anneissia japonica]XP_033121655.1 protein FAM167A-like [Anneissia japonica]XP_033121656.1 protein FAM167A-like [Anneissia japonica]XP_033121658.1 protein FAM167A-like [Anneissia japonica]
MPDFENMDATSPIKIKIQEFAKNFDSFDPPARAPVIKVTTDLLEVIHEDRESEMTRLKFVAKKLNLATRRPSYMKWLEDLKKPALADLNKEGEVRNENKDYGERKREVEEGISWLRSELMLMRQQDQALAQTLLSLRAEINDLRLQISCDEHKEIIEDVRFSVVDEDENAGDYNDLAMLDRPPTFCEMDHERPLKTLGVTRMNLRARRFSLM